MSLLDALAKRAVREVGDESPEWVEREAKRIRDELPRGDDPQSKALRETGEYAVAKLERNKDALGRMSQAGAVAFLGYVGMGKELEATRFATDRLAFLRTRAGWGELDAAVEAAGDRSLQAKRDHDASVTLAREVGSHAAKTILPFLLAAVI